MLFWLDTAWETNAVSNHFLVSGLINIYLCSLCDTDYSFNMINYSWATYLCVWWCLLGLGSTLAERKLIRYQSCWFKLSYSSFGLGEMRPDNLIDVCMGGSEIVMEFPHVAVLHLIVICDTGFIELSSPRKLKLNSLLAVCISESQNHIDVF